MYIAFSLLFGEFRYLEFFVTRSNDLGLHRRENFAIRQFMETTTYRCEKCETTIHRCERI